MLPGGIGRRPGAAALDGKLIDYASIRQAEHLVAMADAIAAKG